MDNTISLGPYILSLIQVKTIYFSGFVSTSIVIIMKGLFEI